MSVHHETRDRPILMLLGRQYSDPIRVLPFTQHGKSFIVVFFTKDMMGIVKTDSLIRDLFSCTLVSPHLKLLTKNVRPG